MNTHIEAKYGEGRYQITIEGFATAGHGLCLLMTGGDLPHNGGTVVASPRMKSNAKHENDRTADLWVSGVPGHKDTEIGMPIAKLLATSLNEAISLTIGIHLDHASLDEIKLVCDNCQKAAQVLIRSYQAK